ncbi:hypothetical protein CfE428DRAFT_4372 [Chthoniobacter flavus Ellin428]|uniref:Uncharacterized protein n=1 Tax=Chthoniobacter flavus Ellin428 TaxID=497964 RepID=B4D633_9BACT|nr:hypothetical protein [Chthoniobacter flavus]EDY18236.1 hypothetical protein CfE428DRAFT_4372 [Chthoniobacter flavus Ellin428]TCO91415.1 hypothetical protein EV701_108143 [Chthoniobacter flavus]
MRTTKLPVAATLCAVIGAFSIPAVALAKTATKHTEPASSKAGLEFSAGDGAPGHFRLTCHDVSAYDALVAIAKHRGYVLTFDQAGEAACRRANLNGVYSHPWMGLEGASIEAIIVESVAQDADLPPHRLLRFIRKNKKSPARIAVVERSSLDSNGQLLNPVAKKN